MRFVIGAPLKLASTAQADSFYKLVGHQYDSQSDRLTLTAAAANQAGEAMSDEVMTLPKQLTSTLVDCNV